jgi:hypothetical protein
LPDGTKGTGLVEKRYLTLVVRLLVDGRGDIQQGVLVDLYEEPVGQFRRLEELPGLVTHWLETRISK